MQIRSIKYDTGSIHFGEESWGYDRCILNHSKKTLRHGIYEIRGLGASADCPILMIWCFSVHPSHVHWKANGKNVTKTGTATPKPIQLEIPTTIAGMSFASLSANVKRSTWSCRYRNGTSTTTGIGGA